jgi:hypothetical protein
MDLSMTGAATGARAAGISDGVNGSGPIVDRLANVPVGGCLAGAHDHGCQFESNFQTPSLQAEKAFLPPAPRN